MYTHNRKVQDKMNEYGSLHSIRHLRAWPQPAQCSLNASSKKKKEKMPTRSPDSDVSSGSCGFYGGSKSGFARTCYDCLNHVVDSEPQGCKVAASGECVSQSAESSGTTGTYCEPDDGFCYQCLIVKLDANICGGWSGNLTQFDSGCVCIRQCESASKLEWGLKTDPKPYNFIIGVVVGFVVVFAFFTYCSCRVVRRRQRELNTNGEVVRVVAYEDRVRQSDEPLRHLHGLPSGTQNFGHQTVVMVDTFADSSSTFSSDIPYAQAFDSAPSVPDCTPSAPAFESSSTSAPTTSYSSHD